MIAAKGQGLYGLCPFFARIFGKIVIFCTATNNFVENDKKSFGKRDRSRKNRERYRNRYRISETEQGGGTGEEKALHRHRKVCSEHPGMPKPMDSFPVLSYYKK